MNWRDPPSPELDRKLRKVAKVLLVAGVVGFVALVVASLV